ncbi:hypothetical protein K438DRAFT_2041312 [Mycena galopus ATCC 62051]|nr:hypothetical protein K438DRAFT_2041312 [Mycena galopus ATCC 62051]
MCLWFQDRLRAWRKAKDSNCGITETRRSLFFFVLGMESALPCLNLHGARVSWSSRYERLMHRLLPRALEHVPLPERPAKLARLRALPLFVSYPPGYYGMTPLDRMGVASLRISDFDPRRLSAVSTSFSSEGIQEFLGATTSSGFVAEGGISAHILSGADLDVFIAERRWNPDEFLDSTPAAALRCDLVPLIGRDLRAPLSALSTPRVGIAPLPIGYAFWIFLPQTHCPPELRAVATHREPIPSGNSCPGSGQCKGSPGPLSTDLVNHCQRTEKKALLMLNARVEIPGPPGKPRRGRAGTRVPG